jgi:hypothetical protein
MEGAGWRGWAVRGGRQRQRECVGGLGGVVGVGGVGGVGAMQKAPPGRGLLCKRSTIARKGRSLDLTRRGAFATRTGQL